MMLDGLRILTLDDVSYVMLAERIDQVKAQIHTFASAWLQAASADDSEVNVDRFLDDLAAHAANLMGVRIAFALLRSLVLDEDGIAVLDETRFDVDLEANGEVSAGFEIPEEQRRVSRAAWLLTSIAAAHYAGLADDEKAECDRLRARIGDGSIPSEAALLDLEHFVLKTHPEFALLSSHEGREKLFAQQRERAVTFLQRVKADDYRGLDPGERQVVMTLCSLLASKTPEDVLPPVALPSIFRMMARGLARQEASE